jgi:hypothetical protein
LDAGGYEAMLHELMHRDLAQFNVRNVPITEGLQEQKKLSLGTSESWWLDVLHRGYVYKSKHGLEAYFGEWHDVVSTEVLFASYSEFAKSKNERHPMARETFGRFMKQMGCRATQLRKGIVGEHITDVATSFGTARKAALIEKSRSTGYSVGHLKSARDEFTAATGLTPQWQDGQD